MSLESLPSSDPSSDILNRDGQHVEDEDGGRRKQCFDNCNWSAESCRSQKLFTIHHHVFPLQVPACCLLCRADGPPSLHLLNPPAKKRTCAQTGRKVLETMSRAAFRVHRFAVICLSVCT